MIKSYELVVSAELGNVVLAAIAHPLATMTVYPEEVRQSVGALATVELRAHIVIVKVDV